jgi:hypothetical protein
VLPASFDRLLTDVPPTARARRRRLGQADVARRLGARPAALRHPRRLRLPRRPAAERFTEETWVVRDICDHEPWPFADDQFDVAVCAHTLEDIRDPVWVCHELARVARAGYVEVPVAPGGADLGHHRAVGGWAHHRWLCDVDPYAPRIDFVFKSHAVHLPRRCFPEGFHERLAPERRVQFFWWEGTFGASERIFFDIAEHDAWLEAPLEAHRHELPRSRRRLRV